MGNVIILAVPSPCRKSWSFAPRLVRDSLRMPLARTGTIFLTLRGALNVETFVALLSTPLVAMMRVRIAGTIGRMSSCRFAKPVAASVCGACGRAARQGSAQSFGGRLLLQAKRYRVAFPWLAKLI